MSGKYAKRHEVWMQVICITPNSDLRTPIRPPVSKHQAIMKITEHRYFTDQNWIFTIGLFLWTVGMALGITIELFTNIEPARKEPPLDYTFGILAVGVIGPILEEIAFRGWSMRKNWTYFGIIALFLFIFPSDDLRIVIPAAVAYYLVMRSAKEYPWSIIIIILSSLLFAVAHIYNYDSLSIGLFFILVGDFGAGLILSYLAIKKGLWASMLLHIAINSTSTIILLIIENIEL